MRDQAGLDIPFWFETATVMLEEFGRRGSHLPADMFRFGTGRRMRCYNGGPLFNRLLSGFALAALPVAPALAGTGDATAGKALYMQNCSACHLASGMGGVHFGQAVSADLRAPGLENTYHNSTKLLLRAILQARDEDNQPLDNPMPAWQGTLTQAQALDIIAYLKTLHS